MSFELSAAVNVVHRENRYQRGTDLSQQKNAQRVLRDIILAKLDLMLPLFCRGKINYLWHVRTIYKQLLIIQTPNKIFDYNAWERCRKP